MNNALDCYCYFFLLLFLRYLTIFDTFLSAVVEGSNLLRKDGGSRLPRNGQVFTKSTLTLPDETMTNL
ncbi:hypothetical protein ASPVEDRAFT_558231 [Aspergillus versicolor CBS 583.65]|uniref:Uncharacterized protein n=1 Tax=Aspergillus versicolor CBS 583.65 TaxID=1036611 RepID=A0A1L9PFQ4_ASPVE|nr:uncharacterized protein ASPVEDRAFT_558231 [Aspergillus versicolor CBS 583.65]OJJ00276.1 hypothetical protein ASPVEDRAFT_558231 [Aspergillus versicolor CBS 583.65]